MKALKILQVTNRIPWPLNDGGNIATYHVTRQLSRAGHGVTLACLNTLKHRQDPRAVPGVDEIHAVDVDTTVRPWGLVKGLFQAQPYNVWRFWSPEFAGLLERLLREKDYDIVQFEGSYLALYSGVVRRHSRARLVLRSHNVEHTIWARMAAAEGNWLKRMYLNNLSPKIARFESAHVGDFDGIVPIADQDAAYYRAQGFNGALRTIPGGVDLEAFAPRGPVQFSRRVCFIGSLEWMPNVQGVQWFLANVWPEVHAGFPNAEFHIAGKNPPEGLNWGEIPGVHMHGMVPDAAAFLREGHIFVVPLLSGGGMRLKVVEAMAAGKCIVSTRVGAEGVAYTDGKEVFLAETPKAWVQVLTKLLAGQGESMAAAEAGMALAAARYSWEAVGRAFEEFYAEVMG